MKTWHIAFTAEEMNVSGIQYDGKRLKIELNFRAPEAAENLQIRMGVPLELAANATVGDQIDLRCAGNRLTLSVNGVLADEEWPYGECSLPENLAEDARFTVEEDAGVLPNIPLREFDGIQGFRPAETVNVGDCMPFADGDTLRIFYLYDRRHHHSKWGLGAHQWAQITTRDLKHWEMHPMAVSVDSAEEGSICTGSTMRCGDKYYAFFAVRTCDGSPAHLTCAVSEDGDHFKKADFAFSLPEPYHAPSARDPKVYREGDRFNMLVTTSYAGQGCLAKLESEDLEHWTLKTPEVYTGDIQPECADRFDFGGHSYLFYGISLTTHYRIKDAEGHWVAPAGDDVVVDSTLHVPKAAVFQNRLLIAGFVCDPEGSGWGGIMKVYEAFPDENGSLRFEELKA